MFDLDQEREALVMIMISDILFEHDLDQVYILYIYAYNIYI